MTVIKIELPDDLAKRASEYGLLTDDAFQQMFEDAIRRSEEYALKIAKVNQKSGIPPNKDMVADVKTVRTERRFSKLA